MRNETITLKQAAAWCGGRVAPEYEAVTFSGANFDTRRLQRGELFVAIAGARDGHDFAKSAIESGAAAVLASRPLEAQIPAVYVDDTVSALQDIAKNYRRTLSYGQRRSSVDHFHAFDFYIIFLAEEAHRGAVIII